MSRKNYSLIAGAASLAMAAALWSSAVIAEPALTASARAGGGIRGAWLDAGRAGLANPRPVRDGDDSEDSGEASGDGTPVPDPQPAAH
jgi:hypothetical protein